MRSRWSGVVGLAGVVGCVSAPPAVAPTPLAPTSRVVTDEGRDGYEGARGEFQKHDRAGDWEARSCEAMAARFLEVASLGARWRRDALYSAALAHQRCGDDVRARPLLEEIVAEHPKEVAAQARLALIDYRQRGDRRLHDTISALYDAAQGPEPVEVETLLNLALLRLRRGLPEDLSEAREDLQRASLRDEAWGRSFVQLSGLHLATVRQRSGRAPRATEQAAPGEVPRPEDVPGLLLLARVGEQVARRHPDDAAVANALGVLWVELGEVDHAIHEFHTASERAPGWAEAWRNHGVSSLWRRQYGGAERSYRRAWALQPGDYGTAVGLARALRGQVSDASVRERMGEAFEWLTRAKGLAPERAEAYRWSGAWLEDFELERATTRAERAATRRRAIADDEAFLERAAGEGQTAEAIGEVRERLQRLRGREGGPAQLEDEPR